MKPIVSVVIPARNEEVDLPQALAAVNAQDFDLSSVEIVVVDGDSSDNTSAVALSCLEQMGLAAFAVLSNPGGNTPSNLNKGLEWSSGEFVIRVDCRSQIPTDYVSRLVDVLRSDPDIAVAGGSQVARARSSSLLDRAIEQALNNPVAMGGSRYRRGATSGPADTAYLGAFRRSELVSIGGWNEHFSTNQDFELSQRIGAGRVVWFEADLAVGYSPRATLGQLFQQYHRFGRWKAHYWSFTGSSPRGRQVALLLIPPVGLLLALAAARKVARSRSLRAPLVAAGGGAVVIGKLGLQGTLAWVVNVLIGTAWWSGVVRGLVRDDVT